MSQVIRIGNDIHVEWTLVDSEGIPYNVVGRYIRVVLECMDTIPPARYPIKNFTRELNTISFTFYGKDQKRTGMYCLKLIENDEQEHMVTFDAPGVFILVDHSWQIPPSGESDETIPPADEGEESEVPPDVSVEIRLTSVLGGGPIGPKGDSAGFGELTATLEQDESWIPSVELETSGPDSAKNMAFTFHNVVGKSAYQIACDHGFIGTEEEWLESLGLPDHLIIDCRLD